MKCHRHLTWTILSNIKDKNAIKWYSPNYFFPLIHAVLTFFVDLVCFWYFETTFDAHQNIETRTVNRFFPFQRTKKHIWKWVYQNKSGQSGQGMGKLGWPPLIVCEKQFIICRWWVRWGIDGFQGERKKDQSSLIKYISVLNNVGCKFPANEWVFLKILRSLIRGWGGRSVKSLNSTPSPKETNQQTLSLIDLILLYLNLDFTR